MAQDDDYVEMSGENIEQVLFNKDNFFVGFKFVDNPTRDELFDIPEHIEISRSILNIPETLRDINNNTQIIGFRTTKACKEAKKIMSIQPIYYSIDRNMCLKTLKPLSHGMLQEIPQYGPTCNFTKTAELSLEVEK